MKVSQQAHTILIAVFPRVPGRRQAVLASCFIFRLEARLDSSLASQCVFIFMMEFLPACSERSLYTDRQPCR